MASNYDVSPAARTAAQFLRLSDKLRSRMLRKTYPLLSPDWRMEFDRAGGVPPKLQPGRVDCWFKASHLAAMTKALGQPQHAGLLLEILRQWFFRSHDSLTKLFLELHDKSGIAGLAAAACLDKLRTRFPDDPYLDLCCTALPWALPDVFAPAGLEDRQAQEPDFTSLDQAVGRCREKLDRIGSLLDLEDETGNGLLSDAQARARELVGTLKSRAAEAGIQLSPWTDRTSFLAEWQRVHAAAGKAEEKAKQRAALVSGIADRLAKAQFQHRLPTKRSERAEWAAAAANHFRRHEEAPAFLEHHAEGGADPATWLAWAWGLQDEAAERLIESVNGWNPEFGRLLEGVNYAEIDWDIPPDPERPTDDRSAPTPESAEVPAGSPPEGDAAQAPEAQVSSATVHAVSSAEALPMDSAPAAKRAQALPAHDTDTPGAMTLAHVPKPVPAPALLPPVPPATQAPPPVVPAMAIPATTVGSPGTGDLLWRLANAGRWGLASHLAVPGENGVTPPAFVFELAALGPRVDFAASQISHFLAERMGAAGSIDLSGLPENIRKACKLILGSAALRPALLAPSTGVYGLLNSSQTHELLGLPAVCRLFEAVEAMSGTQQPLHPELLGIVRNATEVETARRLRLAEARNWIEQAPKKGSSYAPAAQIWIKWTNEIGVLRSLVDRAMQAATIEVETLREQARRWREDGERLVDQAALDQQMRDPIEGHARIKLLREMKEASLLVERLLETAPRPKHRQDHVHRMAMSLATIFRNDGEAALRELDVLGAQDAEPKVRIAVRFAQEQIRGAMALVDGTFPAQGTPDPDPRWLLDMELLTAEMIRHEDDDPRLVKEDARRMAWRQVAANSQDPVEVFRRWLAAENYVGAAQLRKAMAWLGLNPSLEEELETSFVDALRRSQASLYRRIDEAKARLELLMGWGLCLEGDYQAALDMLELARGDGQAVTPEAPADFGKLRRIVEEEQARLEGKLDNALEELRRRLDGQSQTSSADRDRILAVIVHKDLHTANEYLDLLDAGKPLPPAAHSAGFFEAYMGAAGWLAGASEALSTVQATPLLGELRKGGAWYGLDFSGLTPARRTEAEKMIRVWFALEQSRSCTPEQCRELAQALGLVEQIAPRIQPVATRGRLQVQVCDVHMQPVIGRAHAVVPTFGSMAKGRYRWILVWGDASPVELVQHCQACTQREVATVVLCFSRLTPEDRRALGEAARSQSFQGVVLDRGLLVFLAALPDLHFASLLQVALPFAKISPYSEQSSYVAPEMFYGRTHELESLQDPNGACFVYGGRQLGKTTLLREVEQAFHRPQLGYGAIYLDLKDHLRDSSSMENIWVAMLDRLHDSGLSVGERPRGQVKHDAFSSRIKHWLGEDPGRRLLILLDEADNFLFEDGKVAPDAEPFPIVRRLKALMVDTGKRFKVVFAGLHNVQRTALLVPNQPLAHLGGALCIGAMVSESEAKEARKMVVEPFQSLGYRFADAETPSRILALTNYYPSLIQLFCCRLLQDLRENVVARFPDRRKCPPWIITREHVEHALTRDVRREIQGKIDLTLRLDKRYLLIANLMAWQHHAGLSPDGISALSLHKEALDGWPAGFRNQGSAEEFQALLDEMVGLGVVRHAGRSGYYALRNDNVRMLLGSLEQVEQKLREARGWEPELAFDASSSRRRLSAGPPPVYRPFTAHQERELRGESSRVVVVYALDAAGASRIPDALSKLFMNGSGNLASGFTQRKQLLEHLDARRDSGNTAVLVAAETAWDTTWVQDAVNKVNALTSQKSFVTVIFLANPRNLVHLTPLSAAHANTSVRQITVGPWQEHMLRHWLKDHGKEDDPVVRERVLAATGCWQTFVEALDRQSRTGIDLAQSKAPFADEEIRRLLALDRVGPDSPLCVAAELGAFTINEWIDACGDGDPQIRAIVANRHRWAERFGLVKVTSEGKYQFDPFAARYLPRAK